MRIVSNKGKAIEAILYANGSIDLIINDGKDHSIELSKDNAKLLGSHLLELVEENNTNSGITTEPTTNTANKSNALNTQVGGVHYKQFKIQPIEYILANNISYIEGNIIKYISRWRSKNGIQDLEKIKHYVDLLIEFEESHKQSLLNQAAFPNK